MAGTAHYASPPLQQFSSAAGAAHAPTAQESARFCRNRLETTSHNLAFMSILEYLIQVADAIPMP